MEKNILLIATTPLLTDGLTLIEMDVIRFNRDNVHFEVATSFDYDNQYGEQLKSWGIPCYQLPPKNKPFQYMCAIYNKVKEGNYSAVYIHGNSAMMFLEAIPSKIAGVGRVITHCHNTSTDYPIVHYLMKPVFNKAVDVKIACSEAAGKWAYCGKNIHIIKNGVDLKRFQFNSELRERYRKELGWEKNVIIGHVGRFTTQKNHFFLIDIFEELYRNNSRMRLLLIGDGVLKPDVQKYVEKKGLQEQVRFLGAVNNVSDYYHAMDVFLLPSLFEGLSLVVIEAQANGLVCFCSDTCTPESFATNGAIKLPLAIGADKWADAILNRVSSTRRDNISLMRTAGWDKSVMMEKIRHILLYDNSN